MPSVAQQALLGTGEAAAATLTYEAITTNPTEGQTITFTGVAIGSAASDRWVFITIPYYNTGTSNVAIASVTIGGVLATIHAQVFEVGTVRGGCAIVSALVPTGTTATVVINFAASGTFRPRIAVYRATGLQSTTAYAVTTETGGGYAYPRSKNINVVKDGFVLVGCTMYGNSLDLTLTGVTQNFEVAVLAQGLVYIGGSKTTPDTMALAVTIGGLTTGVPGLVMASFR